MRGGGLRPASLIFYRGCKMEALLIFLGVVIGVVLVGGFLLAALWADIEEIECKKNEIGALKVIEEEIIRIRSKLIELDTVSEDYKKYLTAQLDELNEVKAKLEVKNEKH